MDVIILESETYYKLIDELTQIVIKTVQESSLQKQEEWVDTEEAKRLLKIKSKTKLQSLRDNGDIVFSQHGRIIQYSRKSIKEFLDKHTVKY